MPIPKSITRFNKYVTNRFLLLFAGWIPPLAIIEHRGRRSGRPYRTPVLAFPIANGYVFALTYGRNVDWVRNLRSSDQGILLYDGETVQIHCFQLVRYEAVRERYPGIVRLFLGVIRVVDCLIAEKRSSSITAL
jgi:deazaflavin-dependent oxidoreductase (nitroreductase family)